MPPGFPPGLPPRPRALLERSGAGAGESDTREHSFALRHASPRPIRGGGSDSPPRRLPPTQQRLETWNEAYPRSPPTRAPTQVYTRSSWFPYCSPAALKCAAGERNGPAAPGGGNAVRARSPVARCSSVQSRVPVPPVLQRSAAEHPATCGPVLRPTRPAAHSLAPRRPRCRPSLYPPRTPPLLQHTDAPPFLSPPPPTKPKPIRWKARSAALLKALTDSSADILLLQEVDQYSDFWEPQLKRVGFSGVYKGRTRVTGEKKARADTEKFIRGYPRTGIRVFWGEVLLFLRCSFSLGWWDYYWLLL